MCYGGDRKMVGNRLEGVSEKGEGERSMIKMHCVNI